MVALTASLVALAVAVIVGGLVLHDRFRGRIPRGRLVTLHTKQPDDRSLHGLLVAEYPEWLVLGSAEYVTAEGNTPIPGRVRVPRPSVAMVQEHDDLRGERS